MDIVMGSSDLYRQHEPSTILELELRPPGDDRDGERVMLELGREELYCLFGQLEAVQEGLDRLS